MRRAAGVAAHAGADGAVHTLLLRSSPCAEHEAPIGRLSRTLGIPGPSRALAGLPSRTSTLVPGEDALIHLVGEAPVVPDPPRRRVRGPARPAPARPAPARPAALLSVRYDGVRHLRSRPPGEALAADAPRGDADAFRADWDPDGFEVAAYGAGPVAVLAGLARAAAGRDLAAWRVPDGFPRGGGLALAVASAVPPPLADAMAAADAAWFRLEDAAAATGVAERLRGAGRRYLALTPRPAGDLPGTVGPTGHPVVFWLNPFDDAAARAGWYTVEQLDAWTLGEGR